MVPSQTLQVAIQNLERAYVIFFSKIKQAFQNLRQNLVAVHFVYPSCVQVFFPGFFQRKEGFADTMRIPKMDSPLRYRNHRHPPEGAVAKQAWVSLEPSGDCFVSILFQKKSGEKREPSGGSKKNCIGIDVGIANTMALSDGTFLHMPIDQIKMLEHRIGKFQQKIAFEREILKKDKNNFKKIGLKECLQENKACKQWRKTVNSTHVRIKCVRENRIQQMTTQLVENYDVIVLEDLNIKNMTKSAKGNLETPGKQVAQKKGLNRAILRSCLGRIRIALECKALRKNKLVIKVNPKNTSLRCSQCGYTHKSNRMNQEKFFYQACSHSDHADTNASKNILALGMQSFGTNNAIEAPA